MMKVKLLTSMAGPNGSHGFGAIVEMEDDEAGRYCAANLAVTATDDEIKAAEMKAAEAKAAEDRNAAASIPISTSSSPVPVDFSTLKTKADIVAKAKEVHGLELDADLTRKDLLAAIDEHVASQANPPADPPKDPAA